MIVLGFGEVSKVDADCARVGWVKALAVYIWDRRIYGECFSALGLRVCCLVWGEGWQEASVETGC